MADTTIALTTGEGIEVRWLPETRRLRMRAERIGLLVEIAELETEVAGRKLNVLAQAVAGADGALTAPLPDGRKWVGRVTIEKNPQEVCIVIADRLPGISPLTARGWLTVQSEALPVRVWAREEKELFQIVSPGAAPAHYDSLFLINHDTLVRNGCGSLAREADGRYRLEITSTRIAENPDCRLSLHIAREYFRVSRGLPYFQPRPLLPPAPTGWIDWYYYYGTISADETLANIRWLRRHLTRFGVDFVQVDMGWAGHYARLPEGRAATYPTDWFHPNTKFPDGIRPLADAAHEAGMKFGLWAVPWMCNDLDAFEKHPDWFLRHADGSPVLPHGGWAQGFGWILDPFVAEVRRHYFEELFGAMTQQWGVDYFKFDATGWVDLGIRDYVQPGTGRTGPEILREAWGLIRKIAGPERRLLACHAPCPTVAGLADAARVGGDILIGWESGVRRTLANATQQLWQSRFVWHTDPDSINVRPERGSGLTYIYSGGDPKGAALGLEEARAWATAVGLTGQQATLSDRMPDLPRERVELLKRILPAADVRTGDFVTFDRLPPVWSVRLARPGHEWTVAAIFNLLGEQQALRAELVGELSLKKLGLRGPVAVFDFWNNRFLGVHDQKAPVRLGNKLVQVLALAPIQPHPSLVSTNRHVTQGLVDLVEVDWDGSTRTLRGRSNVVARDPYELRIHVPAGFEPAEARPGKLTLKNNLLRLRWRPARNEEQAWSVRFR